MIGQLIESEQNHQRKKHSLSLKEGLKDRTANVTMEIYDVQDATHNIFPDLYIMQSPFTYKKHKEPSTLF